MKLGSANVIQVVPRHSAVLGLPGDRESQIKIQASHENMCRFDPDVAIDKVNYELVEGNVVELCSEASQLGETKQSIKHTNRKKDPILIMPYPQSPPMVLTTLDVDLIH